MRILTWFDPAWVANALRLGIPAGLEPALAVGRLLAPVRRRQRRAPPPPPPPEPEALDDEVLQFQLALICMACL